MPSNLYRIETSSALKLAIMARPRAGDWLEDEVRHWKQSGVTMVISLLEQEEVDDLDLRSEAEICQREDIAFRSFPIADRGVPDVEAALDLARDVAGSDGLIAIHCRAGIGRSSLMAAAILVGDGVDAEDALTAIGKARGLQVPDTDEQRAWILNLSQM